MTTRNVRTVFVFPGQGSQYPGMAKELNSCGEPARAVVSSAEECTGIPITELMAKADARTLAETDTAQLLVFVVSCALLREAQAHGRSPDAVAGHSLGEFTALVGAGMLDFPSALRLVAARGQAMAEAARKAPGAMAAVAGLSRETLHDLCAEASASSDEVAVVANYNSRRQAAVSGDASAIALVVDRARQAGALRARSLPVGGAYHSTLMATAEEQLRPVLESAPLAPPRVTMVSSITGAEVEDPEAYRARWVTQITSPVRWDLTVDWLAAAGAQTFVEVGPGRVLTGLGRDNARSARHLSVHRAMRRSDSALSASGLSTATARKEGSEESG